jgi:hypothetical protein
MTGFKLLLCFSSAIGKTLVVKICKHKIKYKSYFLSMFNLSVGAGAALSYGAIPEILMRIWNFKSLRPFLKFSNENDVTFSTFYL